MPAVEIPSRNSASVSFVSRPKRRWIDMNATEPMGRAMNAKENRMNAYKVPSNGAAKGKNTEGNTSTEAMP